MIGKKLLITNYLILVFTIIGVGLMIPYLSTVIGFPGNSAIIVLLFKLFLGILFLGIPLLSMIYAYKNIKTFGWQMRQFGIFDRIINYTPFFQIISLLLILIYIILGSGS